MNAEEATPEFDSLTTAVEREGLDTPLGDAPLGIRKCTAPKRLTTVRVRRPSGNGEIVSCSASPSQT